MKALVTAANGQVGHALSQLAEAYDVDVVSLPRTALDISQAQSIEQAIGETKPDIIINAAAYTAVDKAESDQKTAFLVNETGAANLASACHKANLPLIHISTDYVYSGEQTTSYKETDGTGPLNIYGKSKLAGDMAIVDLLTRHIILRTSWVFGLHGNNFVKTMLRLGKDRDELGIINDQHGGPTAAEDIAETILKLCGFIQKGDVEWGLYHYSGQPACSWYDFAVEIFDHARSLDFDQGVTVKPIPTSDYPTPAARPKSTILDCSKIKNRYNIPQPDWRSRLDTLIQAEFA
ncbi:MAG: dTDP-4-dehydrorhamnose reductase [Gammaproteobacteria bacterium]|nr:dTDP-4-dehydrorhamnose reductase [Gammaproteobacteria bacterium]